MKIKYARENHPTKPSQEKVGGWVGMSRANYQAIERGKSEKKAVDIMPDLAKKFGIPETWFLEPKGTDPYTKDTKKPEYDDSDDYVDVVLHVPYLSGKVSISMNQITTAKLPAGLARNNTFGVLIVDDDNLPRLTRGMIVFFEPRSFYKEGDLVVFDHPTETVKGADGRPHPASIIRRYVSEGGAMKLKPHNPTAETYLAQGIAIRGAAKVLRRVHGEDWYTDEVNTVQIPPYPPTF